jgi:hypothetical protein
MTSTAGDTSKEITHNSLFIYSFYLFSSLRLVEIAMEAMDLLLMACHAQTLNLFVESFLKMIQKLLEDSNPNLQIMATNSVSLIFSAILKSFN